MPMRGKNSNEVRLEAHAMTCARWSSASASAGLATAAKAVDFPCGSGKSFSVAAVMMPSVPSAPMKRCLRS